jgi:hypothetical protein
MIKIKPKRLSLEYIRAKAEEVRIECCNPPNTVPFPIEELVELKLRIEVIPTFGLKSESDVEAFLSNDLKSMFVDSVTYEEKRYIKRLRFTFAHELGHYYLHKDIYRRLEFENFNDWIQFTTDTDQSDIEWFERQANEFAGRLLVPKDILLENVARLEGQMVNYIEKSKKSDDIDKDYVITGVSRMICDLFEVSHEVIKVRINRENILEELDLNRLFE